MQSPKLRLIWALAVLALWATLLPRGAVGQTPVVPSQLSKGAPNLQLETFYELLDPERHLVSTFNNDGAVSFLPPITDSSPAIAIDGVAFLELEITHIRSLYAQYFLAWAGKNLRYDVRFNDQRVRLWPIADYPPQGVVERSPPFPVPIGATGALVGISQAGARSPEVTQSVRLFGRRTSRVPADSIRSGGATSADDQLVEVLLRPFEKSDRELVAAGVTLRIADVARVFALNRNHSIRKLEEELLQLGAFAAHQIGFIAADGRPWVLDISGADLLTLVIDRARGELKIDAYAYHHTEHSTFSSGPDPTSSAFVTGPAHRQHYNLALLERWPGGQLNISMASGNHLVAPLWQPDARLATLIWTEHADFHEAETDRLITYGNLDGELRPGEGLAGNAIPLTKTVFGIGADIPFTVKILGGPPIPFRQSSFRDNAAFNAVINKYIREGLPFEYGLHTLGTSPAYTAEDLRKVLVDLRTLKPRVWTDHGSVLTNLSRFGWNDRAPQYFIGRTLCDAGINYLWVDGDMYPNAEIYGDISLIRDNSPAAFLYRLPHLDATSGCTALRVFRTLVTTDMQNFMSKPNIESLIENRGIAILHSYFAYSAIQYEFDRNNVRQVKLAPWFNPLLAKLASERNTGRLHLATLSSWGDFAEAVRQTLRVTSRTGITFVNPGAPISGFTVAVVPFQGRARPYTLQLGRRAFRPKRESSTAAYYAFDLPSGSTTISFGDQP